MALEFIVNAKRLMLINPDRIISGEANVSSCSFTFSDEWTGFAKTVVFQSTESNISYIIMDDGVTSCVVPPEITRDKRVIHVGVFCVNGATLLNTNMEQVRMVAGANPNYIPVPTENIYQQIVNIMQTQKADAATALEQAEIAKNKANEVKDLITKTPYVGVDGYWYEWDITTAIYKKTPVYAQGPQGDQGIKGDKGDKGDTFTYGDLTPTDKTDLVDNAAGAWDPEFANKYAELEGKYAGDLTKVKTDLAEMATEVDTIVTGLDNYYVKCLSTDTGALLVVTSGATTGQINLSSVSPRMSTYTPTVGDYVTKSSNILNAELVLMRNSAVKSKAFATGDARFEEIESDVLTLQNKTASYGLRWKISTDTYTRLDNAYGKAANPSPGVNDFDNIMPWAGVRRCNLPDDFLVSAGNKTTYKVNAYYGEAAYKEDGTNGQVMVEVPAFYYKTVIVDADTIEWYISMFPLAGYKLHPWFYDANGNPVNKKYISAYEGSIYDVSAGVYLMADEQIADFTATTGDKLCSIAGVKPCSGSTQNLTIGNSRILSNNRGNGWQQQYFTASSAVQLLMSIEYAGFNSQTKVGRGVDSISDIPNTANNTIITGGTAGLGNKSGSVAGTLGQSSVSYRGIENLWGNILKWVDGFNIKDGFAYISNVNGNFISNKFDGQYIKVGELAHVTGYMSKVLFGNNFDYGFIPSEATGTSSSSFSDYYQQNPSGNFVSLFGGSWYDGLRVGAYYWYLHIGSTYRSRNAGARLCV